MMAKHLLHKDWLVGCLDPKLDRNSGVRVLSVLYLAPGIEPDDELIAQVAAARRDFLAWHGAGRIVIEKGGPAVFAENLKRAL